MISTSLFQKITTMDALSIFIKVVFLNMIWVEAQQVIIVPKSTTVTLNGTATFSCAAFNVATVIFVVADVDLSMWASRRISQSTYSGSNITTTLTVLGIMANNGLKITCRVYLTIAQYLDISPPVQLTIEAHTAPPSAPQNLTAAAVSGTYVVLTWSPPMDLGIGGPLYYNVSYQAVSGSSNVTSSNITTNGTCVNVTNLYPGVTYMMTAVADNGVSGEESKRSKSIYVTTLPTQTGSTPDPCEAWKVGVGLPLMMVVVVVVVVVMEMMIMYMLKKHVHVVNKPTSRVYKLLSRFWQPCSYPPPPPSHPPSAPQNLAAKEGDKYVELTWSPPMDLGIGGLLEYKVSYQAASGSHTYTCRATYITVTNLSPATNYTMTVVADNGVPGDESNRSASINVATCAVYYESPL